MLPLMLSVALLRVGCMLLLDCAAEEYFHQRHSFPNNHTERDTVNDYSEPVSNQERLLAR
jgi:hypothetical protein